ncbi:MAG TPA: glycosyltransferase family 4 protein [Phenylobacterium sp.]|uniref:glycosyltransferase family 4 protein n=1 Tax=Phenylobacterium sp. TaxID=1871053 RepID=UPI002B477E10|nr:glycosyltransferase family 4 protein [Phenylobacterium sp.]HKR88934.1 glycosyltransferase family 4 protein [Phenylobacterium sp.]
MTPAIFFHADGFVLDGPKLMGRQSAGHSFLRAAVRGHAGRPIHALTPFREQADTFRNLVLQMDPQAQPRWIPAPRLGAVAEQGLLFRADGAIVIHARERLRIGPGRYSICGVTHTLSTHAPAEHAADMVAGPVMPWDALICTSTAARTFVEGVLAAQEDLLAWRFGQRLVAPRPQLPVIPLGVHCEDFATSADERARSRAALALADDEVGVLFAGRLTFNGKAHPFQMFAALERVAQATGRKLALVLAGQFPAPQVEEAYRSAMARWAPSIRAILVPGADAQAFARVWRAADLFVSLSDNIQETFGITPVEAMAAGLPVLVSDWDGYKDTVRDGVDGFRVPTWAPPPGAGGYMALDYETGANNYDYFLSRTSTTTSVEPRALTGRLTALVENADLRRRQGEAGRQRALAEFDWAVVYGRYQALWEELGEIRARSAEDPELRLAAAPRQAPTRLDPFTAFAHYPTRHLGLAARARAAPGASVAAYEAMTGHPMFMHWRESPDVVARTLEACAGEGLGVAELAARLGEPARTVVERLSRLAKMELVMLEPGAAQGAGG